MAIYNTAIMMLLIKIVIGSSKIFINFYEKSMYWVKAQKP